MNLEESRGYKDWGVLGGENVGDIFETIVIVNIDFDFFSFVSLRWRGVLVKQ